MVFVYTLCVHVFNAILFFTEANLNNFTNVEVISPEFIKIAIYK